jgi:hypothetical protein
MFLQFLTKTLYSPNIWQNRLLDDIGVAIVVLAVLAVVVHFSVRHIRPTVKGDH